MPIANHLKNWYPSLSLGLIFRSLDKRIDKNQAENRINYRRSNCRLGTGSDIIAENKTKYSNDNGNYQSPAKQGKSPSFRMDFTAKKNYRQRQNPRT